MTVRPLAGAHDDRAITALFDETVLLGAGFDSLPAGFDAYRELCLGWYLGPGRDDAALAVTADGRAVGYALVGCNGRDLARWTRRATARLVAEVARCGVAGRLDAPSRAFHRDRARDAVALVRGRRAAPASVHAHLNVSAGARRGDVTIALVAHIDERCRTNGRPQWFGEMNERAGRRRAALERLGFAVVATAPNHTLSAALGEPVERLTVVRAVPGEPTGATDVATRAERDVAP